MNAQLKRGVGLAGDVAVKLDWPAGTRFKAILSRDEQRLKLGCIHNDTGKVVGVDIDAKTAGEDIAPIIGPVVAKLHRDATWYFNE